MLSGHALRYFEDRLNPLMKRSAFMWLLGLGCLSAGWILGVFANDTINYVNLWYGNLWLFYASTLLCLFGLYLLCHVTTAKWLGWIGRNTMPILLMHKFPLIVCQLVLGERLKLGITGLIWAFVISIAACAACLLAGLFFDRFLPLAVGKGMRKKDCGR